MSDNPAATSIFGEPMVPKHIQTLRERVRARDQAGAIKLERIYTDYDARISAAEAKLQGQLDGHAMDTEAAISELSNRGEQVTAAASPASDASADAQKPSTTGL